MKDIQLFINGEYTKGNNNKLVESLDPSTGEIIAKIHTPSTEDIELAVTSAREAFYDKNWRHMSQQMRADLLLNISEELKKRKKEFIEWEIKDSGSTVNKAKADIHNAASFFKVMSKVASRFQMESLDSHATTEGFSTNSRLYSPVGVCAQIIPWNFPLVMAAWKIGPILATGCTSILKTALETPITGSLLGEIFQTVGLPKGVVNIITGGADVGKKLVEHPLVNKVAFTGSTNVGKLILSGCADKVKRTTMELGGKSPNIILNDANLDLAVDGALYAFLYHSGQACDSGTRILVQDGIYDQFVEKLIQRVESISIGPTTDPASGMGPVINEKQSNTIMGFINTTKKEGAKLLTGGERLSGAEFDKGFYIPPTIFEITPDNTIFHEEIFGPVAGVTKFSSEEEAIELANNSRYGLAAAIWSQDYEKAKKLSYEVEAGTIWINEYHLLNPGMPFGGFKESGLGREMGEEGLKSYLEVKHLFQAETNTRDSRPWYNVLFKA
jgi:acyl-CoA reductase-like NAD-dependent aldehyde dehydrogenase